MLLRNLATAASLALIAQGTEAAPVVQFDDSVVSVTVGDTFDLVLQGLHFDYDAMISAVNNGRVNIQFSSGLLQVTHVAIAPIWNGEENSLGDLSNSTGTLNGLVFSKQPALTDDNFDIATITFRALQDGQGSVNITKADFLGTYDDMSNRQLPNIRFNTSVVIEPQWVEEPEFPLVASTTPVPEPGEWAMLVAGLGLLGLRLRRRLG